MQARYYDPVIGRFYSNDPVGFTAGDITTFNRYSYVGNNPYKYTVPTGEIRLLIGVAILASTTGGYAVVKGQKMVNEGIKEKRIAEINGDKKGIKKAIEKIKKGTLLSKGGITTVELHDATGKGIPKSTEESVISGLGTLLMTNIKSWFADDDDDDDDDDESESSDEENSQ